MIIDFRYQWYEKEDVRQWNLMKLKNSLAIVNKGTMDKFGDVHNKVELTSKLDYNNTRKEIMKRFVFWKWFNSFNLKTPNFIQSIALNLLVKLYS